MTKRDFFSSEKTPWDEPGELAVWIAGALVGALLAHNLMRVYKRRR